jgi:hypothetical protein
MYFVEYDFKKLAIMSVIILNSTVYECFMNMLYGMISLAFLQTVLVLFLEKLKLVLKEL